MANQEQTSLSWLDEEINSSAFSDRRHASRFRALMQRLWRGMGNCLPFACQDSAATKAAYRFLASDKIDEQTLLQGHTEATRKRIRATEKDTMSSPPLEKYTIKLAQLGGYMGKKNKHPPGNIVIWRGLRRSNEIQTGWEMATERCG